MTVLEILRQAVRQLDGVEDFRKDAPCVLELKRQMLAVMAELEAARAMRMTPGSVPAPGRDAITPEKKQA